MKTYVLYHSKCYDGLGAAYSAWKKLGDVDVEYIAVGYGSEPPQMEPKSRVYILDMSYSPETIMSLMEQHQDLILLDHHKSAMEQWTGKDYEHNQFVNETFHPDGRHLLVFFDMTRSGTGIAWDWFHNNPNTLYETQPNRPNFVNFIEDRDLWKFKYPASKSFHSYLLFIPQDFRSYAAFEDSAFLQNCLAQGAALERLTNQIVDNICKNAYVSENFLGHRVAIVNTSSHWSEVGMKLVELYPDVDFACAYTDLPNDIRMFSLRSKAPFDVSKVASIMGGGGHPQAAGFKAKLQVPFRDVIYTTIQHK